MDMSDDVGLSDGEIDKMTTLALLQVLRQREKALVNEYGEIDLVAADKDGHTDLTGDVDDLREELRKRLDAPYFSRYRAEDDGLDDDVTGVNERIDRLVEFVNGIQRAIDDLKDHRHDPDSGEPLRNF